MNGYLRTAVLLAGLTALFVGIGYVVGGQTGMVVAFLFACGTNLWAWWNSDKAVLRQQQAIPVTEANGAELVALVRERIGPVAAFKDARVVPRLPKTRSGKILRATMRCIADGESYAVPPTIDDPAILEEVEGALRR